MLPFVKGKDTTGKEAGTLKRLLALMMVVAVTAALLACTKGGRDNEDGNDTPDPEPQYVGADTMTLRVVGDGENGTLILAGETEVYALPLEGVTLYLDGGSVSASEIESGMSAEVWYTGGVQETYPAKFSQVVAVSLSREENAQYDLCGLYLQVLSDLAEGGEETVAVDLSQAPGDLTEGEKAAIAWRFRETCGAGLADPENAAPGTARFTIRAASGEEGEAYSLPVLQFEAERSQTLPAGPDGTRLAAARILQDCFAVWPEFGTWSGYRVGEEILACG